MHAREYDGALRDIVCLATIERGPLEQLPHGMPGAHLQMADEGISSRLRCAHVPTRASLSVELELEQK